MKKLLVAAALLLACVQGATAAGRASEILEGMRAGFRAMPSYGVAFAVATGEQTIRGNYAVTGERYYIAVGDAVEAFCDGKTRYEVDNRRREVTLVSVDAASRNMLENPVHAFDLLDSQYAPTLLWERDGRAAVRLTPTTPATSVSGVVEVVINTATMRPQSLTYDFDGERMTISIERVAPLTTSLKTYNKAHYGGYEVIDFR